jgi:hypothetical protein
VGLVVIVDPYLIALGRVVRGVRRRRWWHLF